MYAHITSHGWLVVYFTLTMVGVVCLLGASLSATVKKVNLVALGLALVFMVPLIDLARAL